MRLVHRFVTSSQRLEWKIESYFVIHLSLTFKLEIAFVLCSSPVFLKLPERYVIAFTQG